MLLSYCSTRVRRMREAWLKLNSRGELYLDTLHDMQIRGIFGDGQWLKA